MTNKQLSIVMDVIFGSFVSGATLSITTNTFVEGEFFWGTVIFVLLLAFVTFTYLDYKKLEKE